MNNKLGRKITSLTIMTIMVAGGVTFAFPPAIPAYAQSTENLFVSAANPDFENSFAGPMVIEVVVNDPDLKETDEKETEPDVTVNGQILRMVQATDGNWYAYFAETTMALRADAMADEIGVEGTGLDFGHACAAFGNYTDTDGVFFEHVDNAQIMMGNIRQGELNDCTPTNTNTASMIFGAEDYMNVIREEKDETTTPLANSAVTRGQIDLAENEFPAIQLYDFAVDGDVNVIYNRGGGVQQVTLKYLDDTGDLVSWSADRSEYPLGAHVHVTINDMQLNIDPTDEDSWTFDADENSTDTYYQIFDENGEFTSDAVEDVARGTSTSGNLVSVDVGPLNFEDNGILRVNPNTQGADNGVLEVVDNDDQVLDDGTTNVDNLGDLQITFTETQSNSGIFKNTDEGDSANIRVTDEADRGTTATVEYNDEAGSVVVANFFGSIEIDENGVGGTWNSGEEIDVTLTDQDANKNSLVDEDFDLNNPEVTLVPSVRIGSPITGSNVDSVTIGTADAITVDDTNVDGFSDIIRLDSTGVENGLSSIVFRFDADGYANSDVIAFINGSDRDDDHLNNRVFAYLNYDIRSLNDTIDDNEVDITVSTGGLINSDDRDASKDNGPQGLIRIQNDDRNFNNDPFWVNFTVDDKGFAEDKDVLYPVAVDLFRFGQINDGDDASDRFNDAIYRIELEESGDNTGAFIGTMEYIMLNQLNVDETATYEAISPIDDAIELIVHEDLTDEDSVRVNYLDLGGDGVSTQVADQVEAPTHSGSVAFDAENYKVADTVTVTVDDPDLNVDVETIDVFTVVRYDRDRDTALETAGDERTRFLEEAAVDTVGAPGYGVNSKDEPFGRLLDITFDDERWTATNEAFLGVCTLPRDVGDSGLAATGFTLKETAADSGLFTGDFQIPTHYCPADPRPGEEDGATTTGTDMEVNYVDYRDASGEIIEVGDSVGIRANTGSVSLDRTVYPVPFGGPDDANNNFQLHGSAFREDLSDDRNYLSEGALTIHARINDPDFDISASGEDKIQQTTPRDNSVTGGPVKITLSRGGEAVVLATAGAPDPVPGWITIGSDVVNQTRDLGPINEIAPDAGIFELDMEILYTDGPSSDQCAERRTADFNNRLVYQRYDALFASTADLTPELRAEIMASDSGNNARFTESGADGLRFYDTRDQFVNPTSDKHCIMQGDILTVEYTDPTDASGDPNTVTDSATFDLRNGVLQSDKSVYIIGSDMILTLIEPDFDLDNDAAETYPLDLIEWDSDAGDVSMGANSGNVFDPEPSDLRETGDSTGIFQSVIEIPEEIDNDRIERGEEIELEYTDWGPAGADYVNDEDEDVNLIVFTSNFGATIELDQKVYTWTDKVYITIVAPDHNFDDDLIDEIGETEADEITISTRQNELENYKLDETGADTGIFTGEVILTGFEFDADGDSGTGQPGSGIDIINPRNEGNGPTDGFLETTEDDGLTVSFEFSEDETVVGSALVRWNIGESQWLEAAYPATGTGVVRIVDPDMNLNPEAVDNLEVDVWSDSDAGGIQLTVTETNEATGIFEGTVSFTVDDQSSGHRLRVAEGDTVTARYEDNTLPDPFTTADNLDITGTAIIGTIVPPLERVDIIDARLVDSFGGALTTVAVDQQVQITADLASGQDRDQTFAYLLQVQDANGVTVSLAWITGSLAAGQSFSPALSWIPEESGSYTATIFVWESVDNPTALSAPATVQITVA